MSFTSSYERHARMEAEQADVLRLPSTFTNPDSVDAWRHRRMHEMLTPLIQANPNATWITLGDGNYGSDAYYLEQRGVDVLASSLTDNTLKIAEQKGFIKKYAAVNAEHIPFEDESFDFVLCKEAYHHLPRPSIAFYEMLRVAKKAVVLIEPYDGPKRFLDIIKEPMKKLLWGKTQTIHFEQSGNFIYRIHPKEIGKMLAALGYSAMAYRTFNDIYIPQLAKSKAGLTVGHWATRLAIFMQDAICNFRLLNPALILLISFKNAPEPEIQSTLKANGFKLEHLPRNPYV